MKYNRYVPGAWNALCDVCGVRFKSTEMRERWDGKMVCQNDFEKRHPMDLFRMPKDDPSVDWSRPALYSFQTSNLVTNTPEPLVTGDGDNIIW